ncbi:FHA domain-containing protein [Pseudonocardia sp. KRD-184]|uniref:FHA domain-containing protein n=1 Tax=Pseudonocardia oceani TaxID=2792013 RepID=A0ABS6U921_9PSEU|nr:FHA domain-containing protein [Pseudonocardia oceani]MBW0088485.1 FHA domain-containing protein [Pseudonocardia oceani]MBW0095373.1 FHA domain-containing protein [Pseudonocardia oceani]MBW0121806.1 FHA domain-containing protein [Pseudonocardia oceani]MBW0128473.1 FHA domain-containing protein [Pseudonocardia oceani]
METVLISVIAFGLGLFLGVRLPALRAHRATPAWWRQLWRLRGRDPLGDVIQRRALAHARRPTEDDRLQLGALEVHCHPQDHSLVLDRLDLLERAIRRSCDVHQIEIRAPRVLAAVIPDTAQPPGLPDVLTPRSALASTRPYGDDATQLQRVRLEPLAPGLAVLEVPRSGAVLGRDAGLCTLVLDAPTISRAHAILTPRPGRLAVQDAESSNGIMINGVSVQAGSLVQGDVLGLGRSVRFRVVIGDA